MKKIIQHIRNKPEPIRKQIHTTVMVVVGAILFLSWIGMFAVDRPAKKKPLVTERELAPFAIIKADLKDTATTVSTGFQSFKNTIHPAAESETQNQ